MSKNNYYEQVFEITRKIPRGRVTTYGVIADYLALGSARMVGWALNKVPIAERTEDKVPAHRVVNRKGELSGRVHFGNPDRMANLLRDEGIKVIDNKIVDLKDHLWNPLEMESEQSEQKDGNEIFIDSIADLVPLAGMIIEQAKTSKKVYFVGDLGAGKTTLIKLILQKLGVSDMVTSPTFSIVNEYTSNNDLLYHMDLYRIEKIEELYDLGFEEYINSDNWCFIEWPQIGESLLVSGVIVKINTDENGRRIVLIEDT